VHVHRQSTNALARNAPGSATTPMSSAKATTCTVMTPVNPNTEIFTTPITMEIAA
jgi:hypothetical protein